MRTLLCLTLFLVSLSACLAPSKLAKPEIRTAIRKIAVIPVEPPPLALTPAFFEAFPEGRCGLDIGNLYPPQAIGPLVIIGGILVAARVPEAVRRREEVLKKLDEWYAEDRVWVPTGVLGRKAAERIARTCAIEVIVSNDLYTPRLLAQREATWHMENWYRPLRKWYNRDGPALNPEEYRRDDIDAFLEIGMLNYEMITGNKLSIQVMSKLVLVASGKVEARARNWEVVQLAAPEALFRNQGKQFKEIVIDIGEKLLDRNLQQIGIIPWCNR